MQPQHGASAYANFFCQVCAQPIRLPASVLDTEEFAGLLEIVTEPEPEKSEAGKRESSAPQSTTTNAHNSSADTDDSNNVGNSSGRIGIEARRPSLGRRQRTVRAEATESAHACVAESPQVYADPLAHSSASLEDGGQGANMHVQTRGGGGEVGVGAAPPKAAPRPLPVLQTDSFVLLSRSQIHSVLPPTDAVREPSAGAAGSKPSAGAASQNPSRASLSHRLRITARLFDLLSGVSTDVDHPMCADCAQDLEVKLEKRLHAVQAEERMYADFLAQIEQGNDDDEVTDVDEREFAELTEREQFALETLKNLEEQRCSVRADIETLEGEMKELDTLESNFWQEYTAFLEDLSMLQSTKASLTQQLEDANKQLSRLQKTHVFNDAFRIWHDGVFATINGFRLGRGAGQNVEWAEINAALGQTILLVDIVAKKLGYEFKHYRLHPLGSFSQITKHGHDSGDGAGSASGAGAVSGSGSGGGDANAPPPKTYDLYYTNDPLLSSMFFFSLRKFDSALAAFLACVGELGAACEARDPSFKLPYKVHKDKIGDVSIRYQFNNDEEWTKALKFLLINVKWILAFQVSSEGSETIV